MKQVVWKFALATHSLRILMPKGAEVIAVQTQANKPHIWALVNPDAPQESRRFIVMGTGHTFDHNQMFTLSHLGTFQLDGGTDIFHVFEVVYD